MSSAAEVLKQLAEFDKDLAELLKTYSELEQVYQQSLDSFSVPQKTQESVRNTAEVTLTFNPVSSSAQWSS
jgi:hypothetical protein